MLAGRPSSYHVDFQSRMTQVIAFGAPVTEIAEARVQEKTADLDQDAATLINAVKESGAGLVGASTGWSVEDMEDEKLDVKGKIFMLAVGWESVDAHMKARETEGFKNTIGGVKRHIKSMAAFHVAMKYHGHLE